MDIGRRVLHRPTIGAVRLRIWRSAHQLRKALAVGLLLCAALLILVPARSTSAVSRRAETVTVVVAASAISAGAVLSAQLLTERQIPADVVPDGAQPSAASLIGLHSLGPIQAGEIVTMARLLEHAGSDSAYAGRPPGTVPILVRITDPAVVKSLTIGNCVDIYVGEPAAPLTRVLTGGSVIAIVAPEISKAELKTAPESFSGYIVIAVIMSSAEKVASSTSSSIIFATVCGG
ncbi:MAG: SAF domain-containing protein [Antricoccus sp.]